MEPGHLFIEFLVETVNPGLSGIQGQVDLRERLVRERIRHHKTRMARGTAQVHETAFREKNHRVPVLENILINLRLDGDPFHAGPFLKLSDLDLIVKMSDVADDGLVLHLRHVFRRNDVDIPGGRHVNIPETQHVLEPRDLKPGHRRLERADRVDLGDNDARAKPVHGLRASFSDIAIAQDHGHLARDHHIRRALDAIRQGFAAAVKVIELGFGHRIIHVDGRDQQFSLFLHLVEPMDAGRRFLRNAFPLLDHTPPFPGIVLQDLLQKLEQLNFVLRVDLLIEDLGVLFGVITQMDHERRVPSVIHNEIRSFAARKIERLKRAPPVLLERLPFPREHGNPFDG